jgi:hypothetical protein
MFYEYFTTTLVICVIFLMKLSESIDLHTSVNYHRNFKYFIEIALHRFWKIRRLYSLSRVRVIGTNH